MPRPFVALGASSAAIAVAAGAFGAHALRVRLEPRLLEVFETAARYQMYHALALIAVGLLLVEQQSAGLTTRLARTSGLCFVAGTVLFSGSLYAMSLTGVTALGAITPLGGVCFIAGWVCLAVAASRSAA